MERDVFQIRWRVLMGLIALGFLVLVARLWYMQLSKWYLHVRRAAENRTVEIRTETPRGDIFDRAGRRLAENRDCWEVQAVPGELPRPDTPEEREMVTRLTEMLGACRPEGLSSVQVRKALQDIRGFASLDPTTLRDVGEDVDLRTTIARIAESQSLLDGITWRRGTRRRYPWVETLFGKEDATQVRRLLQWPEGAWPEGKAKRCVAPHVIGYAKGINQELHDLWRNIEVEPEWRHGMPPTPEETAREAEPGFLARLRSDYQLYPRPNMYSKDSIVGITGVERLCEPDLHLAPQSEPPAPLPREPVLAGLPGQELIEVDCHRQPQRRRYSVEGRRGADVVLTIDARLQFVAEEILAQAVTEHSDDRQGAAVVMDVNTGEVLAMASAPIGPDPNRFVTSVPPELMDKWRTQKGNVFVEKTLHSAWKPGSVFKIVTAAAALETLGLSGNETVQCDGFIEVGERRRKFRCWHAPGHGRVDFYRAMTVSCNVYFYQLAHDEKRFGMSSDDIAAMARAFGLGEETGIGLPERPGVVPEREYKLEQLGEQWYGGDTVLYCIGDLGLLEVTPMQMAMVTAAVANGGKLLRPQIIRELHWPEPDNRIVRAETEVVRELPVSKKTLQMIKRGMKLAANDPEGTGHGYVRSELMRGVTVGGKSGSAQGREGEKTHGWFAAFAPYEKPRYACVVLIARGGYGAKVAGPVVREILAAALKLPRDSLSGAPRVAAGAVRTDRAG